MAHKKSIVQKTLHSICPICGSSLEIVSHITSKRGNKYLEQFIECSVCDYYRIYKSGKMYKNVSLKHGEYDD